MVSAICSPPECIARSLCAPSGTSACPGFQRQVGRAKPRSVIQKMRSNLHRSKEKMPWNVHGGVQQRGVGHRADLTPSPTVEKTVDRDNTYTTRVVHAQTCA